MPLMKFGDVDTDSMSPSQWEPEVAIWATYRNNPIFNMTKGKSKKKRKAGEDDIIEEKPNHFLSRTKV